MKNYKIRFIINIYVNNIIRKIYIVKMVKYLYHKYYEKYKL